MSNPKRYTGKWEGQVLGSPHWEHPEGEWVKWEDYARLKAEVADLKSEADRFKAEVERLTDAITSGNAITLDAQPQP